MADDGRDDVEIVLERDPAPKSRAEALLFSPGLHAIRFHRRAHKLYEGKHYLAARAVNYMSRVLTGADIVCIYQGVTLGGVSTEKKKRHPTIGNNVVIGAGATILGPVTVGDNVRVGAGSVVVKDVPPNSTVVGIPAKIVRREGETPIDLHHEELPDPVVNAFVDLCHSLSEMEYRLEMVEKKLGIETWKKPRSPKGDQKASSEEMSCPVGEKH
jgi:serine O-acetyltransferase